MKLPAFPEHFRESIKQTDRADVNFFTALGKT